jgi:hypothetical protein
MPKRLNHDVDTLDLEVSIRYPIRPGYINFTNTETTYVESSHWSAILERVLTYFISSLGQLSIRGFTNQN